MTPENIGTRIAARRQRLGWTQEELATRTHVTRNTVVNWETGKHYPQTAARPPRAKSSAPAWKKSRPAPLHHPRTRPAIWSMDRFTENERHAMIRALQEERASRARA